MLEWAVISFSGDLPDPGIEPVPLASPALAGRFFTTSTTWEARPYSTFDRSLVPPFPWIIWQVPSAPQASPALPQSESGAETPSSSGIIGPRNNLFYILNVWLHRDPQRVPETLSFHNSIRSKLKIPFQHGQQVSSAVGWWEVERAEFEARALEFKLNSALNKLWSF